MPRGFGISKGRKAVYLSPVSSSDQNPDWKYKPYQHMKQHRDRLFVMDLEAVQNSMVFYQTANGSVMCYDTVPSEFHTQIINLKDGSESFGKEEYEDWQPSHQKKSRYATDSRGTPPGRTQKQETSERRKLTSISSTAEIIKENGSSKVYVQCASYSKRSRLGTVFCRCGKKLGGLAAVQENNAQVTIEKGCQIIQSLVQL